VISVYANRPNDARCVELLAAVAELAATTRLMSFIVGSDSRRAKAPVSLAVAVADGFPVSECPATRAESPPNWGAPRYEPASYSLKY
jgi:hypothetical protein